MRKRGRKDPEFKRGDYMFAGTPIMTCGVQAELGRQEAIAIARDVQQHAQKMGGLEYLQIYENDQGKTVRVIDASPYKHLKEQGLLGDIDFNHFTIMLPSEY